MLDDPDAVTDAKDDSEQQLTPEQVERIRKNRGRALELQRQRKLRRDVEDGNKDGAAGGTAAPSSPKRLKATGGAPEAKSKEKEEDVEFEDFEVGASEFVTKKEAATVYCLPEGTLAVCPFVERENPHRKGWTPMKLYARSDIRRRARERFGGLDGLQHERRRREEARFQRDLEKTKDVFRSISSKK